MTLSIGLRVKVLEKFGDGWWKVSAYIENENKHLIGLYPSNYLQEETYTNKNISNSNNINLLNGCFGASSVKNEVLNKSNTFF